MQRCPKCGYREKRDWPALLGHLAFAVLYGVFILGFDKAPRSYRLLGLGAFLLFVSANWWNAVRNERNRKEYLRLHPGPTERVKEHVRPNPANSEKPSW